jgi:hypothetical protein
MLNVFSHITITTHVTGTAFLMHDSLATGSLGLMSAADHPLKAIGNLLKGLEFLQDQVNHISLADHVYGHESNLKDVLLAVKSIVKAQQQAK